MESANSNLFNEHGLWQTLDALTSNKTQPGFIFFVGLSLPLSGGKVVVAQKAGHCGSSTLRACSKDCKRWRMKAFSK
jgi:hypothetical protein